MAITYQLNFKFARITRPLTVKSPFSALIDRTYSELRDGRALGKEATVGEARYRRLIFEYFFVSVTNFDVFRKRVVESRFSWPMNS